MRVSATPPLGERIAALRVVGDPTYSEAVPGGFTTAEVRCVLARGTAQTYLDGRIELHPDYGDPWIGTIAVVTERDGISTLSCVGDQANMARTEPRQAIYCDTRSSEWAETTYTGAKREITYAPEFDNLRFIFGAGTAYATNNTQWAVYRLKEKVSSARVTFTATRANTTNYGYRVLTAVSAAANTNGEDFSTTYTEHTQAAGGSACTTVTVDCSACGNAFDRIIIAADCVASVTPGADAYITIASPKLYACGLTALTVSDVIADSVKRLPSWAHTTQCTTFIEADSTISEPFVLDDVTSTEQDVVNSMLAYTEYDFGWWSRIVAGKWHSVPVFRARPTTPSCFADVDGVVVIADFHGDDVDELATGARVTYTDSLSRTRVARNVSPPDNWLSSIGHTRWRTASAETSSTTTAAAIAATAIKPQGTSGGTATIAGAIRDANGAPMQPSELHAGMLMRFSTERGYRDVRVISVTKTGDSSAQVEFDSTPARLDVWLAQLASSWTGRKRT